MSVSVPKNFNLGYACICTELRKKNVFCSRTLRLATLKVKGVEYAKELAVKNVKDLLTILEYNVKHEIYLMRISSDIFPFSTHPEYGYSIDFAEEYLKKACKIILS
jgi:UV DNA damage endonuclease